MSLQDVGVKYHLPNFAFWPRLWTLPSTVDVIWIDSDYAIWHLYTPNKQQSVDPAYTPRWLVHMVLSPFVII